MLSANADGNNGKYGNNGMAYAQPDSKVSECEGARKVESEKSEKS